MSAILVGVLSLLVSVGPSEPSVDQCSEPYPFRLRGKDGFRYLVVSFDNETLTRDGQLYSLSPVCSRDGSALYDGSRRMADGSVVRIRASFDQLVSQDRVYQFESGKEPAAYSSEWMRSDLRVELGSDVILRFLHELQVIASSPDQEFPSPASMSRRKGRFLKDVLFAPVLTLTGYDLKDLRRTDQNPDPGPVVFPVKIESPFDINKHGGIFRGLPKVIEWPVNFVLDSTGEMKRLIQVEEINFFIKSRSLEFIPERSVIRVELKTTRANVKGPLHDIGDRTTIIRWRHYDEFLTLDMGEVGEMSLSVDLKVVREEGDPSFWVLQGEPNTFKVEFVEEIPPIHMRASGVLSDGRVVDEFRKEDLVQAAQTDLKDRLEQMIAPALESRFLAEGFGFAFSRFIRNELGGENTVRPATQLRDYKIRDHKIEALFDTHFEVQEIADCVRDRWKPFALQQQSIQVLESESGEPWTLEWDIDEGGVWQHKVPRENEHYFDPELVEADFGRQRVSFDMGYRSLNAALHSSWSAGEFCLSTRRWLVGRPSEVPLIEILATEAPRVSSLEGNELELTLQLSIRTWTRNGKDYEEAYDHLQSSRELGFKVFVINSKESRRVEVRVPGIAVHGFSPEENEFILLVIERVLQKAGIVSEAEISKRFEWDLVSEITEGLAEIESVNLGESSVQASGWLPASSLISELSSLSTTERLSVPLPKTKLVSSPVYWVESPDLVIEWEQESPSEFDVYYSHRLRTSGSWGEWSEFSTENSVRLVLNEETDYEFQVKGMNALYEIEATKFPSIRFFYKPAAGESFVDDEKPAATEEVADGSSSGSENEDDKKKEKAFSAEAKENEWVSGEKKADNGASSDSSEPVRLRAKGAFGCSVQKASGQSSPFSSIGSLFLFMGLLSLIRRRFRPSS